MVFGGKSMGQVAPDKGKKLDKAMVKQTAKFLMQTDHFEKHGVPANAVVDLPQKPKKKPTMDWFDKDNDLFDPETEKVELEMDPEEAWIVCADEINELEAEMAQIRKQKKVYEKDAEYWKKEKLVQSAKDDIGEKETGKLREQIGKLNQEIGERKLKLQAVKNEGAIIANSNQQMRDEIFEINSRLFKRGAISEKPKPLEVEEGFAKDFAVNRRNMEKMRLVRQWEAKGFGDGKMQLLAKPDDETEEEEMQMEDTRGPLMKLLMEGPKWQSKS